MRFPMIAIVLAAWLVSVSALSHAAPASVRATDPAPQMQMQARAESVQVNSKRQDTAARANPTAQAPRQVATDPAAEDAGRGSYGTLLATLMLMGAIAARRYIAGKH